MHDRFSRATLAARLSCLVVLGVGCSSGGDTNAAADAASDVADAQAQQDAESDMDASEQDEGGAEDGGAGDGGVEDGDAAADGAVSDAAAEVGDGGETLPAAIDLAAFCAFLDDAVCAYSQRCHGRDCSSWPIRDRLQEICTQMADAIAVGRVTFDGVQAALCKRDYAPVCDRGILGGGGVSSDLPKSCSALWKGTLSLDDACYGEPTNWPALFDTGCAGGYCELSACPGQCVGFAALGQPCDYSTPCEPTAAFCGTDSKCHAYLEPGDACDNWQQCRYPLACRAAADTTTRCIAVAKRGEDCNDTLPCESGTMCTDGKCVDEIPTDCAGTGCAADQYCPEGAGMSCAPLPTAGMACGNGYACADGLYCASGDPWTCTVIPGIGEACPDNACTAGAWCKSSDADTASCVALVASGGDCLDYWGVERGEPRCAGDLLCIPTAQVPGNVTAAECRTAGVAEGDPCDGVNPLSCVGDLFCSMQSGTCKPLSGAGGECNPAMPSCAGGLFCACNGGMCFGYTHYLYEDQVCQALKADGAACAGVDECQGGVCSDGMCGQPASSAPCSWP